MFLEHILHPPGDKLGHTTLFARKDEQGDLVYSAGQGRELVLATLKAKQTKRKSGDRIMKRNKRRKVKRTVKVDVGHEETEGIKRSIHVCILTYCRL